MEPVVHATHVEAPALDAESRYPDLFGHEPDDAGDPEPPTVDARTRRRGAPAAEPTEDDPAVVEAPARPTTVQEPLTPMGNRRTGVTEAEDIDYDAARAAVPQALQRQAEGQAPAPTSAWAPSWSRRSATSAWRPRSWAA